MSKSKITLLTLFPDAVEGVLQSSILRRAQAKDLIELCAEDLKIHADGKYQQVDESPYGGSQGMLFKMEVLERALQNELAKCDGERSKMKVVYCSPRGMQMDQALMDETANWLVREAPASLVVVSGRYEGVDERFVDRWVDLEVSMGDFVLSGGEIPALALVDGVVRLLPGVLGDEKSAREDSFRNGLLEHPHYTKPREFEGAKVPEVLTSGNHGKIKEWRLRQSLLLTYAYRPDLIRSHSGEELPDWAKTLLETLKKRLRS